MLSCVSPPNPPCRCPLFPHLPLTGIFAVVEILLTPIYYDYLLVLVELRRLSRVKKTIVSGASGICLC